MTKEAIIVICIIIRMLLGILCLIRDTNKFEKAVTVVNAMLMTNATFMLEVTARAEQMPRI